MAGKLLVIEDIFLNPKFEVRIQNDSVLNI
jgi:hypothetical protein